jgi:multiple sugar transport system permease protein
MLKYSFLQLSAKKRMIKTTVFIALIIGITIILFLIYWMLSVSLKAPEEVFTRAPTWYPHEPTFKAYINLWRLGTTQTEVSPIGTFLLNSIIVAGGTTALCLFIGSLAAYVFSRFRFRGSRALMLVILTTQMFPFVMLVISVYLLFKRFYLLNTYIGLILSYTTFALPFTVWFMRAFFDTIPREIDEAAIVDGCNQAGVLFRIMLPLGSPGLLAAGLFTFLVSWDEFLFALTLTTSKSMMTLPPGMMVTFVGQFTIDWGRVMAFSVVASTPVVLLFMFLQRYFVQGITGGAIKM